MNTGVFGGTFDPIHNGHLAVAEEVKERLNLTEIIFVPAGRPWMKSDRAISPAEHRLRMLHLALDDIPQYRISEMEIERAGPSYTIDTIKALRKSLESGDELFFILGRDNLPQLAQWKEAAKLITLCYLVAVPRPDAPRPKMKELEAGFPGITGRVMLLDKPEIAVSASEVQERVGRGLSVRHLVPEAVNRYIKEQGLYAGQPPE
jgi:nicotinate-nucleotide adenylyltransferase